MRTLVRGVLASFLLLLGPAVVSAQSLAGVVRDSSGAVLPGVTVETSSPALITKVRGSVTDTAGQYRIPDLPPGTYKISFTLAGFNTVVREGVELTGSGVATINADMQVGSVAESITVTGESPVVDVQTTREQQVINGEVIRALPASRGYGNYIAAVPAIQATGFGGGAQPTTNFFSARGGRSNEGLIQIDGMNVGAPGNGGGVSGYMYDMNNASEVQVSISGGLGESDRGGPAFNIIPRTGGNNFSGNAFGSFAGDWGQSSNIDDNLRALGFGDLPALIKNWDTSLSVGGPISRNRLWFFGNIRLVGTHQEVQNLYGNKNAGDPTKWTYVADPGIKVRNANAKQVEAVRLTWQATEKNKFGFYIDYTKNCSGGAYKTGGDQCRSPESGWTASGPGVVPGVPTTSPESGSIWDAPSKIMQASWTSPISNRVLIETGYSSYWTETGDLRPYGALTDFISVTEQSTAAGTPSANFIYRGWSPSPSVAQQHATWRGAVSYVSGTNNIKVGYQAGYMATTSVTVVGQQISYRFNNGLPNQLSQRVGENGTGDRVRYDGFYAQDQWTRKRLTLQGGLRYEAASSWAPEGENGVLAAHQFGGAFLFPRTEGVKGYRDLTPRMGAAYDLFGNGKTALKVSGGKYLQGVFPGEAYTINNPGVTLVTTVNRSWSDPNGDRVAQCDFMNPAANGECGAWSNLNWGASVQTTTANPAALQGWNVRTSDWQFGAGVQQQIAPRVSVEVSYNRRSWANLFTTQNRALTGADYAYVTLTAPTNALLPGGGGYPVTFLTRNSRSALGATDSYFTTNKDFGDETHYWHGVDLLFNARMTNGLVFQAGTSTGRGVNDTCQIETALFGGPQVLIGANKAPACNIAEPWLTNARGLVTYTVPKVDVLVSGILRSQPNAQPGTAVATNGASRAGTFRMTAAQYLAATGVPLRAGLATQDVNIVLPGALYGDRINAVDMRFSKVLRIKGRRANVGLDLYNLFNSNTPTTYESVYDPATNGARWMQPTAVLAPRFVRINMQLDF